MAIFVERICRRTAINTLLLFLVLFSHTGDVRGANPSNLPSGATIFSYTGSRQTFVVPVNTDRLQIDACGAEGGGNALTNTPFSRGGYVTSIIPVSPGQTLYVYVGGSGWGNMGYNGGGYCPTWGVSNGGGGTDIRTGDGGTTGSGNIQTRLVVAGGAGSNSNAWIGAGWAVLTADYCAGGGLVGGSGAYTQNGIVGLGGMGGTQTAGGAAVPGLTCSGSAWSGGGGTECRGGGGGWYGGGCGSGNGGGAGGGSSYTTPAGTIIANIQADSRCTGNGFLSVLALPPLPTPAPSAAPTLDPTNVFNQKVAADFLWASIHNGPDCNSTVVGFGIRSFALEQCIPSNAASTAFHPYVQKCYSGKTGLSIIRDTYSDYACTQVDPRGKGKGVVYHAPQSCRSPKRPATATSGRTGQSFKERCDKLPSSLATRDMVVLQSFLRPDCSGGMTGSGTNPDVLAIFLNTCAVYTDGLGQFRRKLTYVSGDGLLTNLVLTETRYKMADKLCTGGSVSQAVIALPYVDGTGACMPDPLHPGRFYMNVFRTLDYNAPSSHREWTMQPVWAAPTMRPTMPVPTPLPSAIPTPAPSPPPLVVVNPGNWPVLGSGGFTDNSGGDGQNINVALFLTTSAALNIASILYYKTSAGSAAMTTARVGGVFTSAGLRGSSVTFTGETASGWQTQQLLSPVSIAAGESFYVVVNMRSYVTSTFPSTSVGTFSNLCSYYLYSETLVRPTNQQCAWNRMVDFQYYLT